MFNGAVRPAGSVLTAILAMALGCNSESSRPQVPYVPAQASAIPPTVLRTPFPARGPSPTTSTALARASQRLPVELRVGGAQNTGRLEVAVVDRATALPLPGVVVEVLGQLPIATSATGTATFAVVGPTTVSVIDGNSNSVVTVFDTEASNITVPVDRATPASLLRSVDVEIIGFDPNWDHTAYVSVGLTRPQSYAADGLLLRYPVAGNFTVHGSMTRMVVQVPIAPKLAAQMVARGCIGEVAVRFVDSNGVPTRMGHSSVGTLATNAPVSVYVAPTHPASEHFALDLRTINFRAFEWDISVLQHTGKPGGYMVCGGDPQTPFGRLDPQPIAGVYDQRLSYEIACTISEDLGAGRRQVRVQTFTTLPTTSFTGQYHTLPIAAAPQMQVRPAAPYTQLRWAGAGAVGTAMLQVVELSWSTLSTGASGKWTGYVPGNWRLVDIPDVAGVPAGNGTLARAQLTAFGCRSQVSTNDFSESDLDNVDAKLFSNAVEWAVP